MPRWIRIAATGACLCLVLAAPAAAAPSPGDAVLERLNAKRHAHGLRALKVAPALQDAAHRYARRLVARRFFSHVSPSGSTMVERIRTAGYLRGARAWRIGENLAWGRGARGEPRAVVRAWMASPAHRHNILDPAFRQVGIGVADGAPTGGRGTTYVTDFGARSG